MFCSSCGENCVKEAKFCHKCGKKMKENVAEGAASVDEGSKKDESGGSASATSSSNESSVSLTFAQFRARKEEDRSKHFRNKPRKKVKLDCKANVDCEVKINVGIMTIKDDRLSIKRGYTLPLNVMPNITCEDLLAKAVEKHSRFHKDVIQSSNKAFYQLLYPDKNIVCTLPGSDEPFTLKRYKDDIDKPYSRITFHLCPSSDYFDSVVCDLDFDSDESNENTPRLTSGFKTTCTQTCNTNKNTQDKSQSEGEHSVQEESDLLEKALQCPVFETRPMTPLTTDALMPSVVQNDELEQERVITCPICSSLYPVEQIEEHADNCSMWLLDDTNECDIPDPLTASGGNTEPATANELTVYQQKKALEEQIVSLSAQLLATDVKRVTVRRKFLWKDFKSALVTKIQPKSTIKVVFSGEPAVDDGGPRRELFSELLVIVKERYFTNGKPVNSTVALNAGDFKTCGVIMGMSIMQGGPAPNFLSPEIASYLLGRPLCPSESKDPLLRRAAETLSSAETDDQLVAVLTSDDVLDALESIGYTGIPQKETLVGVKPIIQSLCIKDQLCQYLPQLLQIESGLDACGILSHMRSTQEIWKPLFASGNCFTITADEFLDNMIVNFSESQIRKDAEIDTFKFFSDVLTSIDSGGIEGFHLTDLVKWMTGSPQIPPLGFPKKFTVEFVHGCVQGCCCRPTASTCDITIKLPVHIDSEKNMEDMIASAVKDSYGFGLL